MKYLTNFLYVIAAIAFLVIIFVFSYMVSQKVSDSGTPQRYEFWDYAHKSK